MAAALNDTIRTLGVKKRIITVFYDWGSPPSRNVLTVCHMLFGAKPGAAK
jgi:hypothetical protein